MNTYSAVSTVEARLFPVFATLPEVGVGVVIGVVMVAVILAVVVVLEVVEST